MTPVSLLASMTLTSAFGPVEQLLQGAEIDDAIAIDRDQRHRLAAGLGGFQHRRVLDGRDNEALDRSTLQRQIVGLAAAAGEHHHRGDDADGLRPPGRGHRPASARAAAALGMDRGGIAGQFHGAQHRRLRSRREAGLVALWSR